MTCQLVQPGSGATRDVALLFLTGAQAPQLAATLGADVCVLAEGQGGADSRLDDALAFAREQAGDFAPGKVWLIGFSAGCQGVRGVLANGASPDVVLAADGIHLPLGTPSAAQVDPWRTMVARARSGQAVFFVSVSQTAATTFRSTREAATLLFDTPECLGSYDHPCIQRRGNFAVYGATGLPTLDVATEHMNQLRVLLPRMIADAKVAAAGGRRRWLLAVVGAVLGWWLGNQV